MPATTPSASTQRGRISTDYGRTADEAGSRKPDLLMLDRGLANGNGVDFIRDLRGWSDVPILVLSAW